MPEPLTLTGRVVSPAGGPLSGATVRFVPTPVAADVRGAVLIMPTPVIATADASGDVLVDLVAGTYAVRVTTAGGMHLPTRLIDVPGEWLVAGAAPTPIGLLLTEGGDTLLTEDNNQLVTEAV